MRQKSGKEIFNRVLDVLRTENNFAKKSKKGNLSLTCDVGNLSLFEGFLKFLACHIPFYCSLMVKKQNVHALSHPF